MYVGDPALGHFSFSNFFKLLAEIYKNKNYGNFCLDLY